MAAAITRMLRGKLTCPQNITSQVRSKSTSFKAEIESFFGKLRKGKTVSQEEKVNIIITQNLIRFPSFLDYHPVPPPPLRH
ncbi:hypothetical protein MKW92_051453 [Papaver armeniacum]|nr:hypothetical protein MKW92_051453 [Papaver armeniacum]